MANRLRNFIFCSVFFFSVVPMGKGQNYFQNEFKRIHFKGLNAPREVFDFEEDSLGYMWLASWNGVFRYDGYSCFPFTLCSEETPSIFAQTLFCSQNQTIWVGSTEGGVFYKSLWSPCLEKLEAANMPAGLKTASILDFCEDNNHRIWFTAKDCGLFRFDPGTGNLLKFSQFKADSLADLCFSKKKNRVFAFSETGSIFSIDAENFNEFDEIRFPFPRVENYSNPFNRLKIDYDGTVWLSGYDHGLYFMRDDQLSWNKYPLQIDKMPIISLEISRKNEVFLCMDDKRIIVLPPNGKQPIIYEAKMFKHPCSQLYFNRHGDIWCLNYVTGMGVFYNEEIKIAYVGQENTAPPENEQLKFPILNIFQDKSGTIWVGTDGFGLFVLNPQTQKLTPFPLGPRKRNIIKTIYQDKNGLLWFGHWMDGMTSLDPKTKEVRYYNSTNTGPYQLTGPNVWAFQEDESGNFWVSTLGEGLIRFSNNGLSRKVYFSGTSDVKKVMDLHLDKNGTLWVVFEEDGLAYLEKGKSEFTLVKAGEKGLASNNLNLIFEDSKGNIWISSTLGLHRWTGRTFQLFTSNDGLPEDEILSITEDSNGKLWTVGSQGLALLQYENGQLSSIAKAESQVDNSFLHLSACLTKENELYIGSLLGLTTVKNTLDLNRKFENKVLFSGIRTNLSTSAKVDMGLVCKAGESGLIKLDLGVRDLVVDFSSNYFPNQNLVKYRYKLEGYSNDWITLEYGKNAAVFTQLTSGKYKLRAQCQSAVSDWSPERTLEIIVRLPIHQSKWFLISLVFLVAVLTIWLIWIRTDRKEAILNKRLLELENRKLEIGLQQLTNEVKESNHQLLAKSAEVAQKHGKLEEISEILANLSRVKEGERGRILQQLQNRLEGAMHGDEDWESFKIFFDKTNHNFSEMLVQKFPNLTTYDVRMSILIRLKLNTKEIANMLNITVLGVQKSRYRLKKRLNLGKDDDLQNFLNQFNV